MEYLNELNNDQFLAVTTNKAKVLVAAGAGSGKTKVLTTRIKYLIDSGVNINNIIAFTFTKKACDEMKYRLKDNDFENVYTFHSYCYKLIMENPEAFGFKDIPYVIDDGYKDILIKNILEDLKLNLNPKLFISYISKRKNGIDIKFDTSADESLYNMIYYRFQEYLMNCGAIDFDDMLSLVVNNIDRLPNKYSLVNNLKYILVDECQDTNQIQFNLIKKLSHIHNNIFMVGDSNQLIYSFRSSDIKIITSFSEEADQVIVLKENYRSSANILEYANNLIRNNNSKISMELFSNIPTKYQMLKESFDNTNQEAERVAARIEYIINKGIYKPSEIAVLYRNNYQSNRIELELTNKGIPFITYGKLPFYDYIECKRIIAVYRFIKNSNDEILFKRIINIDENKYKIFYELYKKSNKSLLDFAISYNNDVISNAAKALITLKKEKSNYTKARFFEAILELLFNNNLKQKQSERIRILKDLIVESELLDECEILNEIIINYDERAKPHGVNLLTIHKSKGLEFKCVFIISLNDGIMPPLSLSPEQLEEERRICYVAITRAKEFLYLSEAEWHCINGIKKKLKPSLFLVELKK